MQQETSVEIRSSPRLVLFLLFCIYGANTMDRAIISVVAEPIKRELLLSDTQLGLIIGLLFALFYSVFGVPMAWLADRFGRVRTITAACIAWSLCSAAGGLATGFFSLAASRIGVAIGEAGGTSLSHSLLADHYPARRRATALGILSLGAPLGAFIGIVACGWVAEIYGWRTALITVSLPGAAFGVALLFLVREPVISGRSSEHPSISRNMAAFFRTPVLRSVGLAAGFNCIVTYGLPAWLPAYLMRVHGMGLQELALYYSLTLTIAIAMGFYIGGRLTDRLAQTDRRAYGFVPCIAMVIGAPFLLAAVLVSSWQLSLALFAIPIMLMSVYLGPSLALVQNEATPQQRSIYAALFVLVFNLIGSGVGPLLVGAVSDAAEPYLAEQALGLGLAMLAPITLVAAFFHYRTMRALTPGA